MDFDKLELYYSLVCFALFSLVKRIVEYFAKEWSEQKVLVIEVSELYSTYKKEKKYFRLIFYQFGENCT